MWLPIIIASSTIYVVVTGVAALIAVSFSRNPLLLANLFLMLGAAPAMAALAIGFAIWILTGSPT